jgi:hypothetical protein
MKIDGLDWMEWLHDQRRAAEADRKRRGLSGADYLRECAREAARVRAELATHRQVTVSDMPATKPSRRRRCKP